METPPLPATVPSKKVCNSGLSSTVQDSLVSVKDIQLGHMMVGWKWNRIFCRIAYCFSVCKSPHDMFFVSESSIVSRRHNAV